VTDAPGLAGITRRWGADAIPVVVAEEAPLVRRQLVLLLEADPRIEVAAEAADAESMIEAVITSGSRMVVVGVNLPPEGGGVAVSACRRAQPSLAAVLVDGHGTSAGVPLPRVVTVALDEAPDRLTDAVVAVA
jgi:two-component system response regulator DesR